MVAVVVVRGWLWLYHQSLPGRGVEWRSAPARELKKRKEEPLLLPTSLYLASFFLSQYYYYYYYYYYYHYEGLVA